MSQRTIKHSLSAFGVKKVFRYLSKNPEKNLYKVINWLKAYDKQGMLKSQIKNVEDVVKDPENNWYKFIMQLFKDVDNGILEKILENFIINATMIGSKRQEEMRMQYDCNIPWACLLYTSRCV